MALNRLQKLPLATSVVTVPDPFKHMKIRPDGGRPDSSSTDPDNKRDTPRTPPLYVVDPTLALTFSVAAREGSFTRAAALLGVNPSTVSRRLDGLEASLGVRLFERDTRHLNLSDAGLAYAGYVQQALSALEAGRHAMESHTLEVAGRLRVTCGPELGRRFMVDLVQQFMALHPKVVVTLALNAGTAAGSKQYDDFDVAVSLGMPDESRAVVSKLGDVSFGYLASPAFLAGHRTPADAADLAQLPLAGLTHASALHDYGVVSQSPNMLLSATNRFATNDGQALQHALLSGQFVGRVMLWPSLQALTDGALVKVLPELDDTVTLYTVAPARKEKSLKAQLFIDFLKTHLAEKIRSLEVQLGLLYARQQVASSATPES